MKKYLKNGSLKILNEMIFIIYFILDKMIDLHYY